MLYDDILSLEEYNNYKVIKIGENNYKIDVSKLLKNATC